ncbi:TonB-dependent siderophore receptor [Pseudomonas sp. LS44]|uniref:TonB-dependent siderophore receptor n=1 Tax=Pseudomonas sp. LS44 TaxID=1357074 RepID=UPI00215A6A4D|nr:TonB-dependent siderophore receptor [Pseudomonas sp. LS44]UVE16893.1 TonB-dependent siderophore receptor [Pseudomonas sp. LS44]
MSPVTTRKPLAMAVRAALFGFPLMVAPLSMAAESSSASAAQSKKGEVQLRAVNVNGVAEEQSAFAPVTGYVAERQSSGTKTDTPILETPQSISVVTADQIRDQGVVTVQDALRYTAGVRSEAYGNDSRGDWGMIRGSEPVMYQDGMQKTFGFYSSSRPDPYTLERIEVLKGPSSMLYGSSPVGGLVNLVSKRPQAEQRGQVQVQYGSFDRAQIAGDLTGSVNEDGTLLYRMIAIGRDSNTQVDHVGDDRKVLAPAITWRPNDQLEWTVLASYQKDESGSTSQFLPHAGTVLPAPNGRISTERFMSEPGFDRYDTEQKSVTSLFSYTLDDVWTLRQNLRYANSEVDYQSMYPAFPPTINPDGRTINRSYWMAKPDLKYWTADNQAEAHFGTGQLEHTLLMGIDYQHAVNNRDWQFGSAAPLDLYDPVYLGFDAPTDWISDPEQTLTQKGMYVQDQLKWDEHWLLTLGLRKDFVENRFDGVGTQKDDKVTGRAGLTYLFDNGFAPYLSYSESFQPEIGLDLSTGAAYTPKEGKQWELGVKYQPPGSRSLFTAAVYDLVENNRLVADPTNPFNQIQIGEAHVQGLELEAQAGLTENWDLIATYSYADSEVSKGTPGYDDGKRLPSVPEHMSSLWNVYRFSLGDISGFRVGAGVRYVGESWDGTDTLKTPSTTLYDAMFGYSYQNWDFMLNANNLEDETYYTTCLARGDCFVGARRNIVGTLAYNF